MARRPAPGKWSAHEHLAHLARHHELMLERLRIILNEDRPTLARYRAETDPEWERWRSIPLEEVLGLLKAQRVELGGSNLVFVQTVAQPGKDADRFPPTEGTIRTLLALGLYEPAVRELEFARARWGDSASITATCCAAAGTGWPSLPSSRSRARWPRRASRSA